MRRLRPELVSLLPAPRGAQPVEGETKRNSNKPSTETAAVTEPFETFIGPEQGLLGHVFRICGVAQDTASHAISQRSAFAEALFELPPGVRLSCLAHQLAPCCASWLDQNQLLHRIPSKSSQRPAAWAGMGCSIPVQLPDAVAPNLVHFDRAARQ